MDVEQKIQFIIDSQAEFWESQKALEASLDKSQKAADERFKKADARMDRFERSLRGMQTLMKIGAREMINIQRAIKELAVAQKRTEATLNAYIRARRNGGGNGSRRG